MTLYTTLPHDKLKTRLKETIHKAFSHRNYGSKFVVLGYNSTYFSNKIQKGKTWYKSKNDADEAVSVVSLTSSSGGYINGRNSANLGLLIDKTSSIYLYVKLKTTVVNSVLKFMINRTTSILKS
jgi:hypothetical protein